MKIFKLLSALMILNLAACATAEGPTEPPSDYLIYGTFFGECYWDCTMLMKIENGKAYADDVDFPFKKTRGEGGAFLDQPLDQIKFKKKAISNDYYEVAKGLLEKFPAEFAQLDSQEFGLPDGDDTGGIYLEVRLNGERKVWTIDGAEHAGLPEVVLQFRQNLNDVSEAISEITKAKENAEP